MDQPLTDEEIDRLAGFLEGRGPSAMNLEMVDGFFVALISGPDTVMPSEYLSQIWGKDFVFDADDEATDALDLLFRHWNTIASELLRGLVEPEHIYLPLLLEDEVGVSRGNDWAKGFMRAAQMRPASWRELIDSEERGGSMVVIMMLAHEDDPEMRPPAIAEDKREELLIELTAALNRIYRYFEPHRREPANVTGTPVHVPRRRVGPKVGRNDPCPCGSGRKFKHCCAATSAVH